MIHTRPALAASAAVTLALGVAACGGGGGGGNGPGPTKLDLVIGNALPLSGNSKALGDSGRKASELALDKINDAIDSADADHAVRIVNEDQGSDTDAALESARKLVDSDKASCLTGPWSSEAVAQTANDVTIPAEVLQITPVATGDDVAQLSDHDLVTSTALPVSLEGDALAKAIENDLGGAEGKTVNVAASMSNDADTITRDFTESWQDKDGTVGSQVALPAPQPGSVSSASYSAQASQITGNGPAAVLLVDDPTGFAQLLPALSGSSGWDPATTWGSDQLVLPGLPGEVGSGPIEKMRALAPGAPEDEQPTLAFLQDFDAASPRHVKPAPYAAQQFDATVLCYLAAVAAGSTDGREMADELIDITAPGGTEYSWEQLPDAIKALENGEDIDYTGASGPIDMDVHGNPTRGVFDVYQYTSGYLKAVNEVAVEQPNPATP
jgi:ABC-type branched-subunit amino acid transport system substrate-binding protein